MDNMTVSYPNQYRNYCVFSPVVNERIKKGESELPIIRQSLKNPKSEDEVVEDLFILNCMIDEGGVNIDNVSALYPELSRYNYTDSPNIQTFLAGIYRKTKVPDAFGPLVAMLIRNSINSAKIKAENNIYPFDPNEEIGGAILDYLV